MFFRFIVRLFLAALSSKRAKGLAWPIAAGGRLQGLVVVCEDEAQVGAIPEYLGTLLKAVEVLQPRLL